MYISPQETLAFSLAQSKSEESELSDGTPNTFSTLDSLHVTFKQDDSKYPDDRQELLSLVQLIRIR